MKLINLIFLLLAIQMTLFIFVSGNMSHDAATGPYNESSNSFFCHYANNYTNYNSANQTLDLPGVRYSSPDLWTMIMCPADGNNSRMIWFLIKFAIFIGALGIFLYANRSNISLLAAPFLCMLGAGAPTIIDLYTFINSQVSAIACGSTTGACFVGQFFAILIAGPLLAMWVASCIDWWTSSSPIS